MSNSPLATKCRLHDVRLFLSASIPTPERRDEYERIPEAPLRIEEAVVCVARAIFMEGGTLVFGAHPSISPLVARVIDHYYLPAPAEEFRGLGEQMNYEAQWKNPSLVIYQSRVWERHWAEATERLTRHPLVRVEWTDANLEESVDPTITDRPQAPKSMEKMRKAMIKNSSPVGMIAIGGMRGVLDEAQLFANLRPGKPIFALTTTGGAAALLPKQPQYHNIIRVMDEKAEQLVRSFWEQQEVRIAREGFAEKQNSKYYVPYALVAQQIVAAIVEGLGGSSEDRGTVSQAE